MNWIQFLTYSTIFLSGVAIGLAIQNRSMRKLLGKQVRELREELNKESSYRSKLSAELTLYKSKIRELQQSLKLHQVIDGEKFIFRNLSTHHISTETGERQERLSELIRIKRDIELKNHKLHLLAKEGGEEYEKLKDEVAGLETYQEIVEESFKTLADYAKRNRAGKDAADFLASKHRETTQKITTKGSQEVG